MLNVPHRMSLSLHLLNVKWRTIQRSSLLLAWNSVWKLLLPTLLEHFTARIQTKDSVDRTA